MDPGLRSLRYLITPTASLLAAGIAVGAAFASGSEVGSVGTGVEAVSGMWETVVGNLARVLPFGYSFGAGMVAAVNPCGFALLPAYLGLYVGTTKGGAHTHDTHARVRRALAVSLAMTVGFMVLFGTAGLTLSLATTTLARYFPWAGLVVGALLILGGGWLIGGGAFSASLVERWAGRLGAGAARPGVQGYFAYGLAYGTASLGCTLPIFLTVVGSALTVEGTMAAALQFLLYGLGMGFVITVLTLSMAFLEMGLVQKTRWLLPYVQPTSALLLLLAGTYLIYYWLTLGGLLGSLRS